MGNENGTFVDSPCFDAGANIARFRHEGDSDCRHRPRTNNYPTSEVEGSDWFPTVQDLLRSAENG